MLPEPALTFTIPSVHDGLPLDCRIYHPAALRANAHAPPWRKHAAVLAHPYAPLGGSFDDPVIETVGVKMLKQGFLLATFNFRGAGHSPGKTSWTSKAERSDFQSVIAFLAYYVHLLDPFKGGSHNDHDSTTELSDTANEESTDAQEHGNVLVIGGYSYGSLITAQLPPLETVLEPFSSPSSASNEAQIRLRAASLAEQQNTLIRLTREALLEISAKRSPSQRGVRVGGDEGCMSPRRSADGRRGVSRELEEKLHELVAKTKSSLAAQRHHRHASSGTLHKVPEEDDDGSLTIEKRRNHTRSESPAKGRLPRVEGFAPPRQAYVLLSPIPGIAAHLVTMRILPNAFFRPRRPEEDPAEAKLVRNPTLAVHGDGDMFVPPYKAREWMARLADAEASKFRGVEVPTAGHFWVEEGVMGQLLDRVGEFMRGLVVDHDEDQASEDKDAMDH